MMGISVGPTSIGTKLTNFRFLGEAYENDALIGNPVFEVTVVKP